MVEAACCINAFRVQWSHFQSFDLRKVRTAISTWKTKNIEATHLKETLQGYALSCINACRFQTTRRGERYFSETWLIADKEEVMNSFIVRLSAVVLIVHLAHCYRNSRIFRYWLASACFCTINHPKDKNDGDNLQQCGVVLSFSVLLKEKETNFAVNQFIDDRMKWIQMIISLIDMSLIL